MNEREEDHAPAIHVSVENPAERGDPLCRLLFRADADYVTARILFICGLAEPALFHTHQAVEKYLKAFLHSRLGKYAFTHDLKELCADAARVDEYFSKPGVWLTCKNLSLVFEWTRYPETKIEGFGFSWGAVLDFLDEFAYTARSKIPFPQRCFDLLQSICEGDEPFLDVFGSFEFVASSFFRGNRCFLPKSKQQEDGNG